MSPRVTKIQLAQEAQRFLLTIAPDRRVTLLQALDEFAERISTDVEGIAPLGGFLVTFKVKLGLLLVISIE